MTKSLMISIRPEHAFNILNGKKTLELRKTVPKDFKGWVYIYCTKGKDILEYSFLGYRTLRESSFYNNGIGMSLNGKVVARFWFDEYLEVELDYNLDIRAETIDSNKLATQSCLTQNEIANYFMNENGDVNGYVWLIKELEIFDEPMELKDFGVKRAPQSYQYVYIKEL